MGKNRNKKNRLNSASKSGQHEVSSHNQGDTSKMGAVRRFKSHGNGEPKQSKSLVPQQQMKTESLVLWRHPLLVIYYSFLESSHLIRHYMTKLWHNKLYVLISLLLTGIVYSINPDKSTRLLYWVWLGILSSVGFGTGLHTFVLFLGPFIVSVTMAANQCRSLDFPSPPYPDEIICGPPSSGPVPSTFAILAKVIVEAFMWGAGTAIGELPPYFMARRARLSGSDSDNEDLNEFEQLQRLKDSGKKITLVDRVKLGMEYFVEKIGFFGILLCASIPNPLFDLAGITCGHFLVPFKTFFLATLIGKAVIKMGGQVIFVILLFSGDSIAKVLSALGHIPVVGSNVKGLLQKSLESWQKKLQGSGVSDDDSSHWLKWTFEKFILLMLSYFVVSIINSLAQSYHKRVSKQTKD